MKIVLDIENKTTKLERGGKKWLDMSPFCSTNFLVSVGIKVVGTDEAHYLYFNHNDFHPKSGEVQINRDKVNYFLNKADVIIGSNIKYDINWLSESGFEVPEHRKTQYYCTQIAEYVLAKGNMNVRFGLNAICEREGLPMKKDNVDWSTGVTIDQVPIADVTEYGLGDLDSSEAVYLNQVERLKKPENASLWPTINMMCDFTSVLSKWECTGIKIDMEELLRVEKEFKEEYVKVEKYLVEMAEARMGDTPFNINSDADLCRLIYSREPKNKARWAETFGLGKNKVTGKPNRINHYQPQEFLNIIKKQTKSVYKTVMDRCKPCKGTGYQLGLKNKDGSFSKRKLKCKSCDTAGVVYIPQKEIAGFMRMPKNAYDASVHGFVTDKNKLAHFYNMCKEDEDREFFKTLMRYNQLSTYLDTFISSIKRYVVPETGILHSSFNQTIAATGRLSSSKPNFQNQPRATTFPVRRAVVSRFKFGKILKADYAQLEFRTAGELSGCEQVLKDILDKVDVHNNSASIIFNTKTPSKAQRQDAKAHTFKPLYGGEQGTTAEQAYYKAFKERYKGVVKWHITLKKLALSKQPIELPSGRQYYFKGVHAQWGDRVTHQTKIVNYPVQGFATGDIVPIACLLMEEAIMDMGLQSKPFLQVHDEIDVDVFPGEEKKIAKIVADCMLGVKDELIKRYGYTLKVPLEVEVNLGDNWMEGNVVLKKSHKYEPWGSEFYDDDISDIGL